MLLSRVLFVLILILKLFLSATGLAREQEGRADLKWIDHKHGGSILIKILGLNKKQTTTLKSGFSTFSQLSIFNSQDTLDSELSSLAQTACTVKYDMWEEHYEVTLLSEAPKTLITNTLDKYISHCLSVEIKDSNIVEKLKKNGGVLFATLQVEQISSTQAQKVKAWLINQQSSVMRGLFSHMLGDMTLSETSKISVKVPSPKANP